MLSLKLPLQTRIENWVNFSGNGRIPLHPKDYYALSNAGLVDSVSEKYSSEVFCLGGEKALIAYMKETMGKRYEEEEESESEE
jgi:hypothetical protein